MQDWLEDRGPSVAQKGRRGKLEEHMCPFEA